MTELNDKTVIWTTFEHNEGRFHIAATAVGLCFISPYNESFEHLEAWVKARLPSYTLQQDDLALNPYIKELQEYLTGNREQFTVPLHFHGTAFQREVWKTLLKVPYGETISYTDVANRIQRPKAVRAVGNAIGANPILVVIPCHRVVTKNGKLGGFRGGIDMKKQLLELEA